MGVRESGAFRVAEGCPSRDHHLAAARAWRARAAPVPALRARGRGGALERRYAWVARVRGAAARTPSSKLPVDHPRGRPGPPRGRPRPRGVHRASPRPPRLPARSALQCKFQRDKLLINSLGEKRVSFFLLFFICFYFCMAPSYALGSLAAQQFSLHFNILKKCKFPQCGLF